MTRVHSADPLYRTSDDPEIKDLEGVYFYGGPFSNFATSPIALSLEAAGLSLPPGFFEQTTLLAAGGGGMVRERIYPTVEHFFAAWKSSTEYEHEQVRIALTPATAKARGRRVTLRPDWEEIKYRVMLVGLRQKFRNPTFREALLCTGDRNIYEDSPTDFIWGFRRGGRNLLGKALMEVRAEIQKPENRGRYYEEIS